MKAKNKFKNGFTLVEVLVSIAIFSMSILGLLSVMASGIINTTYAKNKIIAGYLAQEGIEYMRNLRDTYVFYDKINPSNGWKNGTNGFIDKLTTASCFTGTGCYFGDLSANSFVFPSAQSMTKISMTACGTSCPVLLYDNVSTDSNYGKYNYTSGSNSDFIRQIKMTSISANEIKVSSTVYWKQGSNTFSTTLSENLFNWY